MSSTDILQDVHDKHQMPAIRKGRLILCHIIAIVCLGYFGAMVGIALSTPEFDSINEQIKNWKKGSNEFVSIERLQFWNRVISILGYAFAFFGGTISFYICRKIKISTILALSILLYSFIIFYISQKFPFIAFLFPGGYLLHFFGWNIGPVVNLVYLMAIALFLFNSKRVKHWYTKAVVE